MKSTLALLSAGAPAKLVSQKKQAPVKYGFCVKCETDGKRLRPSRLSASGRWVYCNYCTDCHRLSCSAYRQQNQQTLNRKRRERYERQKLQVR